MSIGFTSADEPQPLIERQCPQVDLQYTETDWQAQPTGFLDDPPHVFPADSHPLVTWHQEELVQFQAVRLKEHGHDADILAIQTDDSEILCIKPLFVKLPLLILISTQDLLPILLERSPFRAISELAIARAGYPQFETIHGFIMPPVSGGPQE